MVDRRQRDKEQTMQEILTTATKLFSQKGLHGTSLRDIEKASGISKGLILHHYETKENLYNAVQDSLIQEYTSWMAVQREASDGMEEMISTAIRESLIYLSTHTEYRRIMLWSYLEGLERTTDLEKRFTTYLIEAMRAGQKSGLIRGDINAFIMPFIIRGTIDYWIQKEVLRGKLSVQNQGKKEESDEELIDALVKILLK